MVVSPINSNAYINEFGQTVGGTDPSVQPSAVWTLAPQVGVSQLVAGSNVTLAPPTGLGEVTISATAGAGGVSQIVAGANVTIDPTTGVGSVTINSSYEIPTVTSVVAGTNITSVVDVAKAWTINAADSPVKAVLAGTNITSVVDSNGEWTVNAPDPPNVPVLSVVAGTNITSVVDVAGAWTINAPNPPDVTVKTVLAGTNITSVTSDVDGNWTVNAPDPPNVPVLSVVAGTNITSVVDVSGAWTVNAAAPQFNLEGLQNAVGIFPATPFTSDTVALAANNQTGTAIVPDGVLPTSSTTADGTPCWLYTKPLVTFTGFNWYQYNPRFGAPSAPLPIMKNKIKTLWALVQPTVNTNIYTAGVIALNAYTYDDADPPTSGFYNTRWAYSNQSGINTGQTGVNLYASYTYLLYAQDAPRVVNQQGVGVPDSQEWGLRNPYDVHTDVNHIALPNVVIAFNPTATTNYRTWTSTTAFLAGQTCVFSGFGTNFNGLFYTCALNNTNQPPVSATGVPNTTFWTVITPQPSGYNTKPVSQMDLTGASGNLTSWGAGSLLKVLEIGYSYGPDSSTTTESVRYSLN